jgi:DNA-binding IclR family transcriptional regulator
MTPAHLRFLDALVARYDETDRPVDPVDVARAGGLAPAEVDGIVAELAAMDLLRRLDDGRIRPTVTARELLALDLTAADIVCLDPVPKE